MKYSFSKHLSFASLILRYGRKTILTWSLILSSFAGIIQSYSINYAMFVVCEVICAAAVCPMFTCALVLALEWATNRDRVTINSLINFPVYFGTAAVGVIASFVRDFRPLIRWAYGPSCIIGFLMFFGPESFRWLLAHGKREKIEQILKRAAKINKREISPRTWDVIDRKCTEATNAKNDETAACNKIATESPYHTLLSSRTFIMRICINALCWITGNYISQGIAVMAVTLQGNKYQNFVILSIGAAPSCFISLLVQRFLGRRSGIITFFLISGATIVISQMLPKEYSTISLVMLLCGRCFVMVGYIIVYVHTSELWPTKMRHSMVGFSSTCGRIGSILAPLTPLLVIGNVFEIFIIHDSNDFLCFTVQLFRGPPIFMLWINDYYHWFIGASIAGDTKCTIA